MSALPRSPRRIALVHDAHAADGDAAGRDVFDQMDAVEPVLAAAAQTCRIGATLDLAQLKAKLEFDKIDAVFNLAESVSGVDRLQVLVPLLLEELRIPFTGCASAPMLLSNDKIACKRFLAAHGLPVPAFLRKTGAAVDAHARADWFVKAVSAHASLHLSDSSILRNATAGEALEKIRAGESACGIDFFAEEFIDGREFNISLLGREDGGVDVLPVAEIDFSDMPEGREKIVGYAAKWAEDSPEYAGTARTFSFPERDAALIEELAALSKKTWDAMRLAGYARVDCRVDSKNRPFILEVNVNPCLTPGAGFAAAAERGGLPYPQLIRRIVSIACRAE